MKVGKGEDAKVSKGGDASLKNKEEAKTIGKVITTQIPTPIISKADAVMATKTTTRSIQKWIVIVSIGVGGSSSSSKPKPSEADRGK